MQTRKFNIYIRKNKNNEDSIEESKVDREDKAEKEQAPSKKDDSAKKPTVSVYKSSKNKPITADMEIPLVIRKQPDKPDSKVKIDAFDVLWNRRLGELRDFHLDNGHSDVPSNYQPNK